MSKRSKSTGRVKKITCKKCGYTFLPHELEPTKMWPFVSPMPDSEGRVTITTMATWKCPECGNTIRGAMGKTKGEFSGKSKRTIIEQALSSGEKIDLESLAKELKVKVNNLIKIVNMMVKEGQAKGKVEGTYFIPA